MNHEEELEVWREEYEGTVEELTKHVMRELNKLSAPINPTTLLFEVAGRVANRYHAQATGTIKDGDEW